MLNREAMEITEEQHSRLKEVELNVTTPPTSEAGTFEPETYGQTRLKITSRVKLISVVPNTLPQEAVVCISRLRQEHPLEECVIMLRDEVFRVIPGMVNMQHGTASRNRKIKSGSDLREDEVFGSYHLPQVPDMPIADSGHGHKVTIRNLVVRT